MAFPKCNIKTPSAPGKPIQWTEATETRLKELARKRSEAFKTLSAMYAPVDPVAQKSARISQDAQKYWEGMVLEAGHLTNLSSQKNANASAWLANWIGTKTGLAKQVREPILNIKRQADGLLRETAVYSMMVKQSELNDLLKSLAKKRGDTVRPQDVTRALEEGMTPQRMSVYFNTPTQEAHLMDSYQRYVSDMVGRGYTQSDITEILTKSSDVSSQFDSLLAVQKATGMDVETMFNIGMMPRQMTEDGFATAKLAGAVSITTEEGAIAAANKSRATWNYLPEDHAMTAQLLNISQADLHGYIANPGDFAQFLSKNVTTRQLDALVDSGIMSKVPMLTSEVAEFMTRKYQLPLGTTDLFISDPLEASKVLIDKMKVGVERSAMVKLVEVDGLKAGWAIPASLAQADPQYSKFLPLNTIPELMNKSGDTLVHPIVHGQLRSLISVSKNPSEMGKLARMFQQYTSLFSKQALGNPLTSHAYLSGQFLGNAITSYGGGASLLQYGTSVQDMLTLAFKGLDKFDTAPKYIIDGVQLSERDLIAKTMRMFSHEILPGITGKDKLLKFEYFNPIRISEQVGKLYSAGGTAGEFLGELGKMADRTHDAVMSPSLRMAAILDTASHLALVRQYAPRIDGSGGKAFLLTGTDPGPLRTWEQLTEHVKRHVPMFDDMGAIPTAMTRVLPFTGWAMQNLPLQLADMVRNPSKWYNYSRIHAIWNDQVLEGADPILAGEMSPSDAGKYGIVIRRDSTGKGTVILQTDQYDGKWSSMGWLLNTVKSVSGSEKGSVKEMRDDVTSNPIQKGFEQAISKSYFAGMYKAVSGMDPYTGRRQDPSDYNGSNQFMGMTMAPWMQNILSLSPVLTSIDRLPFISGTRAVVDPRTGVELEPAVRNWLGGAGELPPSKLTGVEQTIQVLGGRVRYIDGVQNMRYTEADTEKAINALVKKIGVEQVNLADDVKRGAIDPNSPSYDARLANINKMADASIQLNFDLARIQTWGVRNGIPSGKQMLEFKQRGLVMDGLPFPGSDHIRQALDDAMKLKGVHNNANTNNNN